MKTLTKCPKCGKEENEPSFCHAKKDNLLIIAKEKYLDVKDDDSYQNFIDYYTQRDFPNDPHYMAEWADRFRYGKEFYKSDLVGQRLLLTLNPEKYLPMNRTWGSLKNIDVLKSKVSKERILLEKKVWKETNPTIKSD